MSAVEVVLTALSLVPWFILGVVLASLGGKVYRWLDLSLDARILEARKRKGEASPLDGEGE